MSAAYLDSSALVKLIVVEAETHALEADLAGREALIASALALVECRRAAGRAASRRVRARAERVLETVYLMSLSTQILEQAATLRPSSLRSLDAIHIATALAAHDADLEVITYDERMAEGARANGLRVVQPGR